MGNFTEFYIGVFCVSHTLYLVFALYRDIHHMRMTEANREEWLESSKNITRLVVEMDRMRDTMGYLLEKEKGAEREG